MMLKFGNMRGGGCSPAATCNSLAALQFFKWEGKAEMICPSGGWGRVLGVLTDGQRRLAVAPSLGLGPFPPLAQAHPIARLHVQTSWVGARSNLFAPARITVGWGCTWRQCDACWQRGHAGVARVAGDRGGLRVLLSVAPWFHRLLHRLRSDVRARAMSRTRPCFRGRVGAAPLRCSCAEPVGRTITRVAVGARSRPDGRPDRRSPASSFSTDGQGTHSRR
jgi:hypothetical protein